MHTPRHSDFARLLIAPFQISFTLLAFTFVRLRGKIDVAYRVAAFDKHTRYVLAANHQSRLDPFIIFGALPFRVKIAIAPSKFMVATSYYFSGLRPLYFLLGCFPAHQKNSKSIPYGVTGAVEYLQKGYNICIFPEGRRTLPGQQKPYDGISKILESYPQAELVLAHIEWQKPWHARVVISAAPQPIDRNSPNSIMKAIYDLQ
jgi:1-acyl-sn-glycerol-3-phosphate acyltransferase